MDEFVYFKVLAYITDNNLEIDQSKFSIFKNSSGVISIDKWEYLIEKPDEATLSKYNSIIDIGEDREEPSIIKVMNNKKINKLKKVKNGSFVYDTDENSLKIYIDGVWKFINFS